MKVLLLEENRYICTMRKLTAYLIFFSLMLNPAVFADDFFDNYTGIDRAWDGQKPVTDTEFEEAINVLTEKQKKFPRMKRSTAS